MRYYRQALAEHPNLIPLLSEQTMTAGSVLLGYDRVAAVLGLAGFPEDQVVLWVSVLDSYALGAALDLAAPDEVWRVGGGAQRGVRPRSGGLARRDAGPAPEWSNLTGAAPAPVPEGLAVPTERAGPASTRTRNSRGACSTRSDPCTTVVPMCRCGPGRVYTPASSLTGGGAGWLSRVRRGTPAG